MQYAEPTPAGEQIVMPETATQCLDLYERDSLVPLGDFGREAGFECPVLMTPTAVRAIAANSFDDDPKQFARELVSRLRDVHGASRLFTPVDAYVVRVDLDDSRLEELLVRQNFDSREPFVLITERF